MICLPARELYYSRFSSRKFLQDCTIPVQHLSLVLLHTMQYNKDVKEETQKILTKKALVELRDTYRDAMIVLGKHNGATVTELAEVHKVNKSTISRILKKNADLLKALELLDK